MPLSRTSRCLLHLLPILLLTACVGTSTRQAGLTRAQLVSEQQRQEELAVQASLAMQHRLDRLAWPILRAALPLCATNTVRHTGIHATTVHGFAPMLRPAAQRLGFSDTLTITSIPDGSPAALAGLRPGDRLTHPNGAPLPVGRNAPMQFGQRYTQLVTPKKVKRGQPVPPLEPLGFAARRGVSPLASSEAVAKAAATPTDSGARQAATLIASPDTGAVSLAILPDSICGVGAVAQTGPELNAWTDGCTLWVTSAMMRFAATDDELATVVAHEVGHAVMRHIDAQKQNVAAGALFGALLDIAAASQGVNTGGEFTNQGARLGAMTFSQDVEREADYVGMYLLARSGRPVAGAAGFRRRMAQESPGSIQFASSHPTTAERFVRLEQAAAEIAAKQAAGEPLLPNRKEAAAGTR